MICTHMTGTLGEDRVLRDVTILDVSLVEDGHQFGLAPDGTWHWPAGQLEDPGGVMTPASFGFTPDSGQEA